MSLADFIGFLLGLQKGGDEVCKPVGGLVNGLVKFVGVLVSGFNVGPSLGISVVSNAVGISVGRAVVKIEVGSPLDGMKVEDSLGFGDGISLLSSVVGKSVGSFDADFDEIFPAVGSDETEEYVG